MQRLNLKSIRYDHLGRSVLVDARNATVEITHEAIEALANRNLDADAAILQVAQERKRITKLAEILPADDGRIRITQGAMETGGLYDEASL